MKFKKTLAAVLAGAMALSTMAVSSFAAESKVTLNGNDRWWAQEALTQDQLFEGNKAEDVKSVTFVSDGAFKVGFNGVEAPNPEKPTEKWTQVDSTDKGDGTHEIVVDPATVDLTTDIYYFAAIASIFTGTTREVTWSVQLKETEPPAKETVKVNYYRNDGKYDGWNVYFWGVDGIAENCIKFEAPAEGATYATAVIEGTNFKPEFGFIVRYSTADDEWANREQSNLNDGNRKLPDGAKEVYVISGDKETYAEDPKAEKPSNFSASFYMQTRDTWAWISNGDSVVKGNWTKDSKVEITAAWEPTDKELEAITTPAAGAGYPTIGIQVMNEKLAGLKVGSTGTLKATVTGLTVYAGGKEYKVDDINIDATQKTKTESWGMSGQEVNTGFEEGLAKAAGIKADSEDFINLLKSITRLEAKVTVSEVTALPMTYVTTSNKGDVDVWIEGQFDTSLETSPEWFDLPKTTMKADGSEVTITYDFTEFGKVRFTGNYIGINTSLPWTKEQIEAEKEAGALRYNEKNVVLKSIKFDGKEYGDCSKICVSNEANNGLRVSLAHQWNDFKGNTPLGMDLPEFTKFEVTFAITEYVEEVTPPTTSSDEETTSDSKPEVKPGDCSGKVPQTGVTVAFIPAALAAAGLAAAVIIKKRK